MSGVVFTPFYTTEINFEADWRRIDKNSPCGQFADKKTSTVIILSAKLFFLIEGLIKQIITSK